SLSSSSIRSGSGRSPLPLGPASTGGTIGGGVSSSGKVVILRKPRKIQGERRFSRCVILAKIAPVHHPFGRFFGRIFLSFAANVDSMKTVREFSVPMAPGGRSTQANSYPGGSIMIRVFRIACACALAALLTQAAAAQESKSAKATREKLKQKASVDAKDQGTKSIFDELLG